MSCSNITRSKRMSFVSGTRLSGRRSGTTSLLSLLLSWFLDQRLEKANSPGLSVDGYVREASHIGTYAPWKARIRALFLLEIIIFGITASAEITFCATAFFRMLRLRAMIARVMCPFRHVR
jgi:hypothetical protein